MNNNLLKDKIENKEIKEDKTEIKKEETMIEKNKENNENIINKEEKENKKNLPELKNILENNKEENPFNDNENIFSKKEETVITHHLKKKFKPNLENLKSQYKEEESPLNLLENILENNDTDNNENNNYTDLNKSKSINPLSKITSENEIVEPIKKNIIPKLKSKSNVVKNPFEHKKKKVNLFNDLEEEAEEDNIFSNKQGSENIFEFGE